MQCTKPFTYKGMILPCGKCRACRIAKSREWSTRLMHESDYHKKSAFVTLTYSNENLPVNGVLIKSDLQKFIKRLRRDLDYENRKIKYYACGEYGEKYGRPHYHLILFGIDGYEDKKVIEENWSKGLIHTGSVTYDSCRYVCDYFNKDDRREKYPNGVLPFKVQSNGIGKKYIQKNEKNLVSNGFVRVKGVKTSIPRYYKNKLIYGDSVNEENGKRIRQEKLSEYYQKYDKKEVGMARYNSRRQSEKNTKARQELKNKGVL